MYDVSNGVFRISALPALLTITSPNGGESSSRCSTININWNARPASLWAAGGTSGVYKLEYSSDGGSTWNLINNNVGCSNNTCSYGWTLPNIINSQIKVRVSDANDASIVDVSDGNMSTTLPATPVRILTPNGGENWIAGTTQNITYVYGSGTSQVLLESSVDSLVTWTNISGWTTANGSYGWVVPNVPSSKVFVRITGNQYNGCDYDVSDAKSTITSTVAVTSPNGGESWQATVGSPISSINISNAPLLLNTAHYYDNGGAGSYYNNTGYTQTLVPDNPLNKLKVVVNSWKLAAGVLSIYDGPNTSFNRLVDISGTGNAGSNWTYQSSHASGSLTFVFVPNNSSTGINWGWDAMITSVGTATKNLTWNIVGTSKVFDLDYSLNGGSSWTRLESGLSNTSGVYAWQVPNTPTTQGRFRVRDAGNNAIVDSSDANFTITNVSPVFVLTTPNGGESYVPATTTTIRWYDGFVGNTVNLEYSIDNGANWLPIVSNYTNHDGGLTMNEGTYVWTIPNTPSAQCLVRVKDAANGSVYDVSNGVFRIGTPYFVVTSPNGGERYYIGQTKNITWTSPIYNLSNVKIEYTTNAGMTWNLITPLALNTGTYSWVVPSVEGIKSNCKIRVSKSDESYYYDESNNVFEIRPGIIITSPNGNSTLFQSCTQSSVTWQGDASTSVKIELSLDSGLTWSLINSNVAISTLNNNYNWSIPNTPSANSLVRVTDNNNPNFSDVSDSVFTIRPSLVLNYPSYGATFATGAVVPITWTANGTSNYYNLDYSLNNGSTWTNITTNTYITNSTYNWTVPSSTSSTVKIRITDFASACKTTTSVVPFIITTTQSNVLLTGPVSTTLNSCGPVNITWTSPVSVTNVNLLYSLNGGTTWNVLQTNVDATLRTYAWTVPNIASTQTLFKIVDAANPNNFDISRGLFTINPTLSVSISANKTPVFCVGDTVTLTSSQLSNNLWSNGETTRSIKVVNSGSYSVINTLNSCSATSNIINVVANAVPARPVITLSGSATICGTDKTVLVSNNASGNTWLPGGQTTQSISTSIGGSYALMYTNQYGCTSTSLPITITVIDNTTTPIITANSSYNVGSTISLSVNTINNASYLWSGPNNFSSTQKNPTINNAQTNMSGLYSVVATISNCNTAPASFNINVVSQASTLVTGQFVNYRGDSISNVGLLISGNSTLDTTSSLKGKYAFNGIIGGTYTISPYKRNDGQKTNGVSTLDIIKIQSHILRIDTLDSPYKLIAADVNSSGTITSLDLLYTRRLILGIDQTFPGNKLWAFVDSSQVFADRTNPFPFRNSKSIGSLQANTRQSFIGVKLGDVNDSWNYSVLSSNYETGIIRSMSSQASQKVILQVESIESMNHDTIYAKIKVKEFEKIKGLQGTLNWNTQNLKFVEVIDNPLHLEFGLANLNSGKLPILFNDPENKAITLNENDVFLTLKFAKNGSFNIDSIGFDSSITPVECYNDQLQLCNIIIQGSVTAKATIIDQDNVKVSTMRVYPNPTTGIIIVDVFAKNQEQSNLVIYDEDGRQLHLTNFKLNVGLNQVKVDLGGSLYVRNKYYIIKVVVNGKPLVYKILLL